MSNDKGTPARFTDTKYGHENRGVAVKKWCCGVAVVQCCGQKKQKQRTKKRKGVKFARVGVRV